MSYQYSHDFDGGLARAKKIRAPRAVPSIIAADVVFVGSLYTQGELHIDGTIEGDVSAATMTVGAAATIHGDIVAKDVIVRGRVLGNITARRVQLCGKSHIRGDIQHESLIIEQDAHFEGTCRHARVSADEGPDARA